jgi:RNA polymerase sigma-70 factor, ECF subfamily
MSVIRTGAMVARPLDTAASEAVPPQLSDAEREVVRLFDESRTSIFRYVLSLGLSTEDGEEITQEIFLALFQHLRLGKSRRNLRGWIFSVAHNLALKRRHGNHLSRDDTYPARVVAESQLDPTLNPEEQALWAQRQIRLQAVLAALPEQDQCCLRLRAEGLRYREISRVLGISLGAVSLSLTRSLKRLRLADGR